MRKNLLTMALVATAMCANAQSLSVATLEDVDLSADSHMPLLTAEYDEIFDFQSGDFLFEMNTYSDWQTWWGYGVSNHTSKEFNSFDDQFNSCVGAGNNASANYGVAYVSDYMGPTYITLTTDDEAVVPGVYVTNAAYTFSSMINGDAYAKQFGQGDWYKLTITAYNDADELVGTKDYYLADLRSENEADWYIVNDWQYVDLSELGAIRTLKVGLSSSDTGDWGMNTPAYVCFDDLGAEGTEQVPAGNWSELHATTGICTVNASSAVKRFDLMGRSAQGKGIQIVRMADGSVRKAMVK